MKSKTTDVEENDSWIDVLLGINENEMQQECSCSNEKEKELLELQRYHIKLQKEIDKITRESPTIAEDVAKMWRDHPEIMKERRLKRSIKEKNIELEQQRESNDQILNDLEANKVDGSITSSGNTVDLSEWE
ncbi:MAG: hypothetical protein WA130_07325 [Candidatus Methanoperedens sp.]